MTVNSQIGGTAQLTVRLEQVADLYPGMSPADAERVRDLAGGR
ncbi:hypothetical protein ABT173_25625 [Streptomyces sp. NPDC001795]